MDSFFTTVPAITAAIYAFMPLWVGARIKMRAAVKSVEIAPQDFPAQLAIFFETQARALEQVGFHRVAYLRTSASVLAGVRNDNYLVMMLNRATGDGAMIAAMMNVTSGVESVSTKHVEVSTRFADGRMFDTLNSSTLAAFGPVESEIKTRVPAASDPRLLYAVHRFVIRQHNVSARPVVYDESNVGTYLEEEREGSLAGQVRCGHFYFNKAQDLYRPTLKGAYLMTWKQMWPFSFLRRGTLNRRGRKILQEFHAANPTLPPLPPLPA